MKKHSGMTGRPPVMLVFFLLTIGLIIAGTSTVFATDGLLRRYSGSAYIDETRYSVYAVAEEMEPGTFAVRVALQYAPDYFTNDEIVAYQLRSEGVIAVDVSVESQARLSAQFGFSAVVMIPGSFSALQVVPVYDKFGPAVREALTITQASEVWMQYYNGTPLVIQNMLPDGWVAVTIGGNADSTARGYMKAQFIAFGNDVTRVQPAMPVQRADVVFTLFAAPDEASVPLAGCQKGTEMTVMGMLHHSKGTRTIKVRVFSVWWDSDPSVIYRFVFKEHIVLHVKLLSGTEEVLFSYIDFMIFFYGNDFLTLSLL